MPKYTGGIGGDVKEPKNWAESAADKLIPKKEAVNANVVRMMQKGAPEEDIRAYISGKGYDADKDITFWKRPSETPAFSAQQDESALSQGFKHGLKNVRGNFLQLLAQGRGLVGSDPPEVARQFSAEEETRRARYAQSPAGQTLQSAVGQGIAESAPFMLAPPPARATGLGGLLAYNTGMGLVQGATDFVPEGGSRLSNTMFGGGLGMSVGTVGAGLGAGAAKFMNRNSLAPQEQELLNLSNRYGVDLQYPDIRPSAPIAPTMGSVLEKVPFLGTGGARQKGALQAENAANKFKEGLNVGNVGDYQQATALELENKKQRLETAKTVYYTAASKIADKVGNIPPAKTLQTISTMIADEQKSLNPDAALIGKLQEWQQALSSKQTNFSQLNTFQDQLQAEIRKSKQPGGQFLDTSGAKMQRIKKALDADIEPNIPKDALAYKKTADGIVRDKLEPFRDEVGKIMQERDPDAQYRVMLTNLKGKPTTLYNSLTPRGQDAARYGLVSEAVEIAKNPNGTWSPAKFAKYVEDRKDMADAFFQGASKDELDGFTKLMRASARHGQYTENPPTGFRGAIGGAMAGAVTGPAMWLGWAEGSPILAAGVAAGTISIPLMTRAAFTTDAGKKMLLASSKFKGDGADQAMRMLFQFYMPRAVEETLAESRLRTQYSTDVDQQK